MDIEGKNILITGGAGFIGSHLVNRYISEKANNVIVYDNFSTGTIKNLDKISEIEGIKIIKGDILDINNLNKAMKNVDIVSHHAAELEVFTGINNVIHDMRVNIEGTLNILNAALNNEVKKVIYASSGGVYGQAQYIPEDEQHPVDPHWPYGVSKLAGEKYCLQYNLLYGLQTVSLRYGIVYGPREWFGRVLTMFIKRVFEGKPPIIFGNGEQRRDYIYIDDIVEGNILATKNEDANGLVFNVGGNGYNTIKEIAQIVVNIINPEINPIYDDPAPGESSIYQPNRKRLPGELKDFILDSTLINKILKFIPKINIKEGIRREIDWVKNNPELWNYNPRV